jgi:protein ImuA
MEIATRPKLALTAGGPALALARAHEAAGPARRVFAALVAGRLQGPVIWIRAGRAEGTLDPEGLSPFFAPARLVVARARRGVEGLWAAEEALRSGAAPLVVLEPAEPPPLTPVRRLHLAAEAGGAAEAGLSGRASCGRDARAPLCLILTPEGGSAAAVETRWWIDPAPGWAVEPGPGGGPARWRAALLRDKAGPPGVWEIAEPWAASDAEGAGAAPFRKVA